MMTFAFYLFATIVCLSGVMVVMARHPVHSVLWLILAFISAAGLFILLGAEFVAMLLIIVYVGAVAVLFLFVVMMLDIDFASLKTELVSFVPVGGLIALVLLAVLAVAFGDWQSAEGAGDLVAVPVGQGVQNTSGIGLVLYDRYILPFQVSGLILLVAMIGAITLTMRHRTNVKRQDVIQQMHRDPAKAMQLRDVKPGQGL
ncbi:NADH-quinone oxidoreductase subunit J [Paracoccus tibetensis]|jgi:NADH-quinone oxidoreductase subunit J|uniref:NADH-quinone oxidoreductase subunit J n=1 Tax=Paracoccus tibetensis TaxID=336292 RepID=A0A1G5BN25_9RHOB|nr:NADH-quinone oxidoreductase subunit J [Paracoccus tibetensis]SCX91477.1 NADH-quinone oxidoreductase subunit J [Paracoccus tibetensis]